MSVLKHDSENKILLLSHLHYLESLYPSNSGTIRIYIIQPDQTNMAVFFWYLVKRDLLSVHYCTRLQIGQVTFYKVPEKHGHV